jgi:hypothetical protein
MIYFFCKLQINHLSLILTDRSDIYIYVCMGVFSKEYHLFMYCSARNLNNDFHSFCLPKKQKFMQYHRIQIQSSCICVSQCLLSQKKKKKTSDSSTNKRLCYQGYWQFKGHITSLCFPFCKYILYPFWKFILKLGGFPLA